jgi:hypothetical protein
VKQTKQAKNAYREMLIKNSIKHGYSLNKTQKILKKAHVGIKRQNLQAKFRFLKGIEKKPHVEKYIPRKYKKRGGGGYGKGGLGGGTEKQMKLYRVSIAIKNVPLHSTSQKPIYYGFLIQAWSINPEYLRGKIHGLKVKMFELMKGHLISNAYVDDLRGELHIESPVEISGNPNFNNIWRFKVEKNGTVIDDAEGNLEQL